MKKTLYAISIIIAIISSSCTDTVYVTNRDAHLTFSTDTVLFDTIFTGIGSTTKKLKIYNPYNETLKIKSIKLARDNQSPFHLNIDGIPGQYAINLELAPKDSMYIFVEVNINPSTNDIIEKDSIIFETNNTTQNIKTIAFGQNVNLLNRKIIQTTQWNNSKPYLIYNSALVDSLQTLTINEGTKIYFHQGASLFIKGSLKVNGTFENPVSFSGDRLEHFYDDKPGQWGAFMNLDNGGVYVFGGLHFLRGSFNSKINYAIIKNANNGIQIDSNIDNNITLEIANTKISNMNLSGIFAQNTRIKGYNLVINNCGTHAIAITLGGWYEFYHTTIANYTPYSARNTASIALNNYYTYNNANHVYNLEHALFANSIIYGDGGDNGNEIIIDKNTTGEFNFLFDHCLVKLDTSFDYSNTDNFKNLIVNPENGVKFKSKDDYNFELDELSPAINKGDDNYGNLFPLDFNKNSRTIDQKPDLGAYEYKNE